MVAIEEAARPGGETLCGGKMHPFAAFLRSPDPCLSRSSTQAAHEDCLQRLRRDRHLRQPGDHLPHLDIPEALAL